MVTQNPKQCYSKNFTTVGTPDAVSEGSPRMIVIISLIVAGPIFKSFCNTSA